MGTRDINDPRFFDDRNLDSIGEPARFSDYGPGPNETIEYAKAQSAFVRQGMSAVPQVEPASFYEQPVAQGSSGDPVDKIADLVLERVMRKLQDL
jgi:hypothetical protein